MSNTLYSRIEVSIIILMSALKSSGCQTRSILSLRLTLFVSRFHCGGALSAQNIINGEQYIPRWVASVTERCE